MVEAAPFQHLFERTMPFLEGAAPWFVVEEEHLELFPAKICPAGAIPGRPRHLWRGLYISFMSFFVVNAFITVGRKKIEETR